LSPGDVGVRKIDLAGADRTFVQQNLAERSRDGTAIIMGDLAGAGKPWGVDLKERAGRAELSRVRALTSK
jgi:hypothetical protein